MGPLLFAIFINDLLTVITHSNYLIYADDLQVYYSFHPKDLEEGVAAISQDNSAIASWAMENGLKLNLDKCKAMLLGNQVYTRELDLTTIPKVSISGTQLPYESEVKSLGVWITPNLNWKRQVSYTAGKIFEALHSLKFCINSLSLEFIRKGLVESLIFPHFDFACAVYHSLHGKKF